MDKASEAILALKPVSFHYKHDLDPEGVRQFGLIAEQVEKVNPDLVARDAEGKVYTVRYEAVNAMLLNEFLKEHQKVAAMARKGQDQEATIAQLKATAAKQEAAIAGQRNDFQTALMRQQQEINALMTQLQKVSDRIETGVPALQIVTNNP